jgi:FkbM family methyltransferase
MDNPKKVVRRDVSFFRGRIFTYSLFSAILISILSLAYIIPRSYGAHIAARLLFGYPLEFERPFYFEIDYFGMVYTGRSNNWVDSWILSYGAYERPVIEFISQNRKVLRKGRETAVGVDVGAYHGTYSMFMATIFDTVHAIEPNPAAVRTLEKHKSYNKLDRLQIHAVGLGATTSTMPMYDYPLGDSAAASLREDFRKEQTKKVDVQIVTGDEYLTSFGISEITEKLR